ncbi:MAG: 5-(carboxyamino)imidazole ribonucleotide synthase [Bacteroidetes bacterium]|nr:5-(carboxyamino)imidazole ribonucleotide synthase [Bacteroidota bacterium]
MSHTLKIGILGGGQLGRMLLQTAANYPVQTFVLENDSAAPAAALCNVFVKGDIRNYEAVYRFGKMVDVLTIEIENVNLEALFKLEEEGLRIFPKPAALKIIQDKGLQKQFYKTHAIPTSDFVLTDNETNLQQHLAFLPAAHKLRTGGYDGKGVEIINNETEFSRAFPEPSVLEKLVDIEMEIAVIVAKNEQGEIAVYPPVEMVFNPVYNLVDYLISPANISAEHTLRAQKIATQVTHAFNSPGLFAVEMFIDKSGAILVNETAPRAHNSGHQSMEGNFSSQYDMQMRVLLNMPLGNTDTICPSLMLNLIGEKGYNGPVQYVGLEKALRLKNTFVHLYGKSETKPGRKMGHVTILRKTTEELKVAAEEVRKHFKVIC